MKNALEVFRVAHDLTFPMLASLTGTPSWGTVFKHCHGARISAESAMRYHKTLGIPLSDLRPDLWPPEEESPKDSYR